MKPFEDRYTKKEIEDMADNIVGGMYDLKRMLVNRRIGTRSIEDMARDLGDSVEEVAEFEHYYSDPTVSQIEEYALALGVEIKVIYRSNDGKDDDWAAVDSGES